VVYICASAGKTDEFKKLARRIILLDNRIRWNSWHDMLIILLNLRLAVEKYC
jgi:hypothetical protein